MAGKPHIRLELTDGSTEFVEDNDDNETRAAARLSVIFDRIANGTHEAAFIRTRGGKYVSLAHVVKVDVRGF